MHILINYTFLVKKKRKEKKKNEITKLSMRKKMKWNEMKYQTNKQTIVMKMQFNPIQSNAKKKKKNEEHDEVSLFVSNSFFSKKAWKRKFNWCDLSKSLSLSLHLLSTLHISPRHLSRSRHRLGQSPPPPLPPLPKNSPPPYFQNHSERGGGEEIVLYVVCWNHPREWKEQKKERKKGGKGEDKNIHSHPYLHLSTLN